MATVSRTVSVLLGKVDGTFAAQVAYPVGVGPYRVAISDLGNGHPDLVVTNYGDNNVGILLGDGTGAFGSMTTVGWAARSRATHRCCGRRLQR